MNMKRKLIPALAMLLISATMLTSASFAWFTMNQTVKATGMQVQAQAPTGIVISNSAHTDWGVSATATVSELQALQPASTADCVDWVTSTAAAFDDHAGSGAYVELSEAGNHYIKHEFYIKSSTATAIENIQSIDISNVTVAKSGSDQALDKALRVGFIVGSQPKAVIYAPFADTLTYNVGKKLETSPSTSVTAKKSGPSNITDSGVSSIPNNLADPGIKISAFIWFEGEDTNCKSSNIVASLNELSLSFDVGYTQTPTPTKGS